MLHATHLAPPTHMTHHTDDEKVRPLFSATEDTLEGWNEEYLDLAETVYTHRQHLLRGELTPERVAVTRENMLRIQEELDAINRRFFDALPRVLRA